MLLAVTGLRREARIVESDDMAVISSGGDQASLAQKIVIALQRPARGVVSFGIAGALAPSLRPSDCVVASCIIDGRETISCDAAWLKAVASRLPGAYVEPIAGSAMILADTDAKAAFFRRTGAAAVDMESHIAARVARDHGLPFIAVRTISDGAQHTLPPAALVALKPDGRIDFPALARSIFARPSQIPALILTARESERAFAALLRCCSLLGPRLAFPDLG